MMRKKLLSLMLVLSLCLGLTVSVYAEFAEESDWEMEVAGKSNAEVFVGKKTFTARTWDEYRQGAISKSDSCEQTVENVYALAKGDTAVFTYEPEAYTDPSGQHGGVYGSTEGGMRPGLILRAWSDPDGDGVYDGRLISDDGETYEIRPIDITEDAIGPWDYPLLSLDGYSEFAGQGPDEIRLSADRLLELFGPNTIVWVFDFSMADSGWGIFLEGDTAQNQRPDVPEAPSGTAVAAPTNDRLTVDGKAAEPTVYKIDGSNYFKIRDVAALLNGTEKQFAVGYDNTTKSATATTGQGYNKQAGDLAGAAAGGSQTAAVSNDSIYVDGEKIDAQVYKIGGSNYFKLRDLGKALNFYVGWSKEQGMFIETDKPYSE